MRTSQIVQFSQAKIIDKIPFHTYLLCNKRYFSTIIVHLGNYIPVVRWNVLPHRSHLLKMEAADSPETLVPPYQATRCYVILILKVVRISNFQRYCWDQTVIVDL